MRRRLLFAAAASLGAPVLASSPRVLPGMTDGPFYPPSRWRAQWIDWDADLTRVMRDGAPVAIARGDHLALGLRLVDTDGRPVDGADVEIWQCDALAAYRHPGVAQSAGRFDPGFQGFGAARTDHEGRVAFRTIRPVPYPGRTPHIHVKLRHVAFGETSSQLFVDGDPGNARDFLWRRLDAEAQDALAMRLAPADADGLRWQVQHRLLLPA